MRRQHLFTGLLLAGLGLAPVASMKAAVSECVAGPPAAASYTWNFKQEAARLLDRVRADALKAQRRAAVLESVADEPDLDWRFDADALNRMRNSIDDMGKAVCRLETIRRVLPVQERKAIDQTVPFAQSLAANADAAIARLNRRQMDYWQPIFRSYDANMYRDAHKISSLIGRFEKHYQA